jgi:hypothetical protein
MDKAKAVIEGLSVSKARFEGGVDCVKVKWGVEPGFSQAEKWTILE